MASLLFSLLSISCSPVSPRPTPIPPECVPNDQDKYVYNPSRLQVISPCVRVSGAVKSVFVPSNGEDGDASFQLDLDEPFQRYLNEASRKYQNGHMHVEIICYVKPSFFSTPLAFFVCPQDPNPYRGPLPSIEQHIWAEGRLVLDMGHAGWAELHPLYRWGSLPQ